MFKPIALTLCLSLGAFAPMAMAQSDDMTEAEIADAFAKQKTRGLSIAPSAETATTAEATAEAPAGTTAVAYTELPEDAQVNINISFDLDSAALRPDQSPKLVALCNVMKASDIPLFRIIGHTDSRGSDAYNQTLSLLRAEEVKRHLVTDCGLPDTRLEAVGVGSQFPFDKADPKADVNRRVEFQALS